MINLEDSVCLLVDIQERLFNVVNNRDELQENSIKLLKGLKTLGVEVITTQQYTKGIGATIEPICEVLGEFNHIEKVSFSCCGESDFITKLKSSGKKNVIILGIEAHICVLQSALELLENDYNPIVVADCISSRKDYDKEIAINRMLQEGIKVSTYESLLFELCKNAKHPSFKEISKIIK